jgi:putative salt-induced outer membrane protein
VTIGYRTIAALLVLCPTAASAEIQPAVKAMIDAALAGGNDSEIATVAKFAKRTDPASAADIDLLVDQYRQRKTAESQQALRKAGPLDLWDGQGDIGGSRTTGTSDTVGVTAGLYLHREGVNWAHKIRLRGDYQESNGTVTREALLAAYEPKYKIDDRLFVYGLAQYERDPLLGFSRRFSLSSGVGYRVVNESDVVIDLDAGPAFRTTRFIGTDDEETVAVRGSMGLRWTVAPSIKFTNDAAAYVETSNSTLATTSAVDARIIGALSARLSYNVKYESNPPLGRDKLDTLSRASLVYDF